MSENITYLEENPFSDFEVHSAFNRFSDVWSYILAILELVIFTTSVAACLFLLYNFWKFNNLRTRINKHLMHYAINVLFYHILGAFLTILFVVLVPGKFDYYLVCVANEIQIGFLSNSYLFAALLVLDWYLTNYKNDLFGRFGKIESYINLCVYILGAVKTVISAFTCSLLYVDRHFFVLSTYTLLLLLVIVVNVIKRRYPPDNDKSPHAFRIGSFIIFSFIPALFLHFLYYLVLRNFILLIILLFIEDLPQLFLYLVPTIVVVWVGRIDKDFHVAYKKSCQCKKTQYDEEELQEEEEDLQYV